MQHDDAIWSIISQGFCSFKAKIRDDVGHAGAKVQAFCRNPYNTTGVCSRVNCPLANSQYATVVEHENKLYLYMKTVERAHTPKRLWEKIELPGNFKAALTLINENLQWWDRKMVMKCKHRLLRLKQVLIRKRRLAAKGVPKLVGIRKKEEKQLLKKEAKAEKAAKITTSTSKILLERLPGRELQDIPDGELETLLEEEEKGKETAPLEGDFVQMDEDQLEQYIQDDDSDSDDYSSDMTDEESEEDLEEEQDASGKRKHRSVGQRKRTRVEIEQEQEMVCINAIK